MILSQLIELVDGPKLHEKIFHQPGLGSVGTRLLHRTGKIVIRMFGGQMLCPPALPREEMPPHPSMRWMAGSSL